MEGYETPLSLPTEAYVTPSRTGSQFEKSTQSMRTNAALESFCTMFVKCGYTDTRNTPSDWFPSSQSARFGVICTACIVLKFTAAVVSYPWWNVFPFTSWREIPLSFLLKQKKKVFYSFHLFIYLFTFVNSGKLYFFIYLFIRLMFVFVFFFSIAGFCADEYILFLIVFDWFLM